jgi:ankyrin repeat protein
MTALHYAAQSDNNIPILAHFASYGAKMNAVNKAGQTPLDLALGLDLERMPSELASRGGPKSVELRKP